MLVCPPSTLRADKRAHLCYNLRTVAVREGGQRCEALFTTKDTAPDCVGPLLDVGSSLLGGFFYGLRTTVIWRRSAVR